jgi:hypothetical protein
VSCSRQSTDVGIFLGDGTGEFPGFDFAQTSWGYFASFVLADLDGDERRDLANGDFLGAGLIVNRGLGGTKFDSRPARATDIVSQQSPRWIDAADCDGDGLADVVVLDGVYLNRSPSNAQVAARRGNVDARGAGPADVLFVNGSFGTGRARKAVVAWDGPLAITLTGPPSKPLGPARFALYVWLDIPVAEEPVALPFGAGVTSFPTPPSGAGRVPWPNQIWNNLGHTAWLGMPTQPSLPAPSAVVSKPRGLRFFTDFFVQGIIRDDAAPNGRAAVTNGVLVTVR